MSETIERLDYTKAPPGYSSLDLWEFYKVSNDPPGIETVPTMGRGAAFVLPGSPLWAERGAGVVIPWVGKHPTARAAAWAWHDRRLALSLRDEARLGFPIFTMAGYLALTDAQVEHAEANAIGHGPAPEPIDYAADLALLGEDPEVGALIEAHARDKAAQERYADS